MPTLRQFWWLAALFVVSTLPMFRDDFLFSDDYYWFDIQHARPFAAVREATQMNISNGRPVLNVVFLALFPLIAERSGWLLARGLGVAVLLVCMALLSRVLRERFGTERAGWLALLTLLLPGFVLFAFWIIGVPCLVANIGALLAFALAIRPGPRNAALAVAMLILALSAYQPHAMLYFALLAFWLAYTDLTRAVWRPFVIGFAALALYFPLAKLLVRFYAYDVPDRGHIVIAPLQKLVWLGRDALPFAAKMWSIVLSERAAVVIVAVAFGGAAVFHRVAPKRVALVSAALVLTLLPHLLVRETVVRWRVVLPLSVGLLLVWAVLARVERWPKALLAALTLAMLGTRTYELATYGVAPERAQVAAAARMLHGEHSVFVVRPTADDPACVVRVSNDEFTAPSSQHDFAAAGIVRLASLMAQTPMPATVTHDNDVDRAPADATIVDLRHMACGQVRVLSPNSSGK